MTTKEKHLAFWTALKTKDETLFAGTPSNAQYYNVVNGTIFPLKIRLDVYCRKKDYESKGYLTICVMLSDDKASKLRDAFPSITNYTSEDRDGRIFILRNREVPCVSGDKVNEEAKQWFVENVQKINEILK